MIGRRLPLKTKLLLALLGPLLALGVLGFVQVRQLRSEAQLADSQRIAVDDNVAIIEVLSAIRSERDAQLTIAGNSEGLNVGGGTSGADRFFARVRSNTDERFEEVLADPNLSEETRDRVVLTQGALDSARRAIGDEISGIRSGLVDEMTDPSFVVTSGSTMGGLQTFDALIENTIALFEVDPSTLVDPETAIDLTSLEVVTQFDELVRREALTYLELSLLPIDEQPDSLVQQAHILGGQVEALEATTLQITSESYRGSLSELLGSREYQDFRDLRSDVLASSAGEVVVSESTVLSFLLDLTTQLNEINGQIIDGARFNAEEAKTSAERNLLVGGLLMALLALAVALIAYSSYRSIRRPLLTLTDRSREIADTELPAVVALLRQEGLEAEVPEIVPIEAETSDEIGGLVLAFNDMHRTAVELASEQAASRRTVAEMFVNLGRRNQKLLTRILTYLDSLEQEERDPEMLEKLFKVDHLATRMRRNAESLLVLAGARASRVFGEPVLIADVARSALAEVEGYERVHLDIRGEARVNGDVVADLAHLLAELMENALSFSPPTSPVVVIATTTPNGYYMAVADQGIGMSSSEFEAANNQISQALTLEETPSKFLGHHVVGRLAARHGIEVQLIEGLVTGVTARIMLPTSVLIADPADETNDAEASSSEGSSGTPAVEVDEEIARALERVDPNLGEGELSAAEWSRVNTLAESADRPSWLESMDQDVAPSEAHSLEAPVGLADQEAEFDSNERQDASAAADASVEETRDTADAAALLHDVEPDVPMMPAQAAEPETPPPGRDVLDTSLLPRRRRGEDDDSNASNEPSFGDQVAIAERRSSRASDVVAEPQSEVGENGEFRPLTRRLPGKTRAEHNAAQPITEPSRNAPPKSEEPDEPKNIRKEGEAFASSLVGFQQGVSRATSAAPSGDQSENNSGNTRSDS